MDGATETACTAEKNVCEVCGKIYAKAARLQEHRRTHTGERPYVCAHDGCGAAYMRATHLAAHARTHQDESAKRFTCCHGGCEKRFWTSQHLHRHVVSCHSQATPVDGAALADVAQALDTTESSCVSGLYRCDYHGCDLVFAKRKHLRQHVQSTHKAPDDPLPYACEARGCGKRFATNAKRRAHARTHDDARYLCALPHTPAMPSAGSRQVSDDVHGPWCFGTWTELQQHTRTCHPPQCPRADCAGRTFANRENLRKHMRMHDARDRTPEALFACDWNGCARSFSSQYALDTHVARVHLQMRPFACDACGRAFGYRHLLKKHMARCGKDAQGIPVAGEDPAQRASAAGESVSYAAHGGPQPVMASSEGYADTPLLGKLLARQTAHARTIACPWPQLRPPDAADDACTQRFSRLYDVRRHLASAHALQVHDDELRGIIRPHPAEPEPAPKRVRLAAGPSLEAV